MADPIELWRPTADQVAQTQLTQFLAHVDQVLSPKPAVTTSYEAAHAWSTKEYESFWREWLSYSGIIFSGNPEPVYEQAGSVGGRFFNNVTLNFAENLLRHEGDQAAVVAITESRSTRRISRNQLREDSQAMAQSFSRLGLKSGDCVAGYIPNSYEAVVAMLGATALGCTWTSCSPDFGSQGVLDRFGQTKPKVLIVANGYCYGGKSFPCLEKVSAIRRGLPELEHVVWVNFAEQLPAAKPTGALDHDFEALVQNPPDSFCYEQFGFNHPLFVLYSSGTTGKPKCIVHGVGGTLLQHTKELMLHCNLLPEDNICYFTTCGWMMWNWLVSSLFVGATVTTYDGSPVHPSRHVMWDIVAGERLTHFGTSPKFIGTCRSTTGAHVDRDFSGLRSILATGAPLLPEDYDWIYKEIKADLQLSSISGGTDIISCFMLGSPNTPVFRGEIQVKGLGMDIHALSPSGESLSGQKGELACRTPFPSMPVAFWDDPDDKRYKAAYFKKGDHVWYHGDFIEVTASQGEAGGIVVYGRSDATLNPGGVRIGTAEIYRLVETLPQVADSIVIGQPWQGDVRVVLFVKMAPGASLSLEFQSTLRQTIRAGASPRHVPACIVAVEDIPYTMSGKKVELAVLKMVQGEAVLNEEALANPQALEYYKARAELG